MPETLVELRGVGRRFGSREALADVDLEVGAGQIVGLAGPNGSGKTTLLKILAGFMKPTSGSVRVFGLDPRRRRDEVMRDARFAFAPPALYEALTAREHLVHLARLGFPGRPDRVAIDAALALVGLAERADDRVREYSFGMRQRLALAQALVPTPRLLVLDEPTDGLDPLAVLELRGVLERLRRERGVAVLLASHLLIELDELVDGLVVLDEGRVLFRGAPADLRADGEQLVLRTAEPERAVALLSERGHAPRCAGSREVVLATRSLSLAEAAAILSTEGLVLDEYRIERPTLERALLARLSAARLGRLGRLGDNGRPGPNGRKTGERP